MLNKHKIFPVGLFIIGLAIVEAIYSQVDRLYITFLFIVLLVLAFYGLCQKHKEHVGAILNNISDSFYAVSKDMRFTYCNKGAIKYFGTNPVGTKIENIYSEHLRFKKMIQKAIDQKKTVYDEYISPLNDRWIAVNIYPAEDGSCSVFFRDIHEFMLAQEQLKQAKERFLKVFNLNPNIMILTATDSELTFIDVNDAYLKVGGLSSKADIIGRPAREGNLLNDKEKINDINKLILRDGCISNYEIVFRSGKCLRDGLLSAEIVEIGGENCVIIVITDITEKKQMDREFARYDSLNLVGQIAASIGHEVRNPMTTVRGYLQLFQMKPEFSAHRESIDTMIEELDRANAIITEFLTLAKNKTTEMKPGNLNHIVNALFPLIQADAFRLGHSVQFESKFVEDILLNEKEIRQLILNLVRNSFEAMSDSGIVKIKTYGDELNVIMEISDTGSGISKEVLDKIGTPFITTKENGTGLGLSVCYRIAQRHQAKIVVKTDCTGTTFYIRFPKNSTLNSK